MDLPPFVSVHHLMDMWVTSTFWLLWIMPLWTFVCLCRHVFSFLFGCLLRSGINGSYMVTLCLIFWGIDKYFLKWPRLLVQVHNTKEWPIDSHFYKLNVSSAIRVCKKSVWMKTVHFIFFWWLSPGLLSLPAMLIRINSKYYCRAYQN